MEEILKSFEEDYALNIDKTIFKGDVQRSSNNPVLFVFIGDSVKEASKYINNNIKEKWDNGEGIVYINISTEDSKDSKNIFNIHFPCNLEEKKLLRKSIRDSFYKDKNLLEKFNSKITAAREGILCNGNLFDSFENISISVITGADDPLNIILPEITILIKKKMLEAFKIGSTDLYVLVKEKNMEDEFFSYACVVSFFRELEYIQRKDFSFNEKIAVYGQERELFIKDVGPVFYMTYVLEEKNEKGEIPKESIKNNYEIISYINLLKNRNVSVETYYDTENQYYDNNRFKVNITFENSFNTYVTAGLSKVKRPSNAIAVAVVKNFYEVFWGKLKRFSNKDKEDIVKIIKLDRDSLMSKTELLLPNNINILDMNAMMTSNTSMVERKLSKLTLKEVEENLYGDRCECFFQEKFQNSTISNFYKLKLEDEIKTLIEEQIINNSKFGLYCAFKWTSEQGEIIQGIRESKHFFQQYSYKLKEEIENIYQARFTPTGFRFKSIFGGGGNIKEVKEKIFSEVYNKKLYVLKLDIIEKFIEEYEGIVLKIHEELSENMKQLQHIEKSIKAYENEIIKKQDEYTSQNISVYYSTVVDNIVKNLEENHGEDFYFQNRYIGNVYELLKQGKHILLLKITEFCSKYILSDHQFYKSFEEEFNERANINIENWDNKVLSKDELYRKLYELLDDSSKLKVYLMNYDVKSHQEKYFFGDYSSDFIKYAFDFDRRTRNYKIGYVHERRTSGIEKLNLMGGFAAKDLIYIKTAVDFYNFCLENGYELHGIDINKLPQIT